MKIFLRMKAWMLFLFFAAPFLFSFFINFYGFPAEDFEASFRYTGYANILMVIGLYGWLYSIGVSANSQLQPDLKRNDLGFKLGLGYAGAYSLVFFGLIGSEFMAERMSMIMPLHLLAMFGAFYGLWFSARQLVALKESRKVTFAEYSGPFFLMWFFPIGVWFVQPIVNELLGGAHET
ncbi:MAG: hypothetical protein V2I57_14510 [Xanthomonadales bacterium]|nr:hypothetical protein [Xanthomonadales bacterium]